MLRATTTFVEAVETRFAGPPDEPVEAFRQAAWASTHLLAHEDARATWELAMVVEAHRRLRSEDAVAARARARPAVRYLHASVPSWTRRCFHMTPAW